MKFKVGDRVAVYDVSRWVASISKVLKDDRYEVYLDDDNLKPWHRGGIVHEKQLRNLVKKKKK